MENCLFCKILAGEILSSKVYEDEFVYAFRDIHPQAPTHILVIPKKHVASMAEVDGLNDLELASCLRAIRWNPVSGWFPTAAPMPVNPFRIFIFIFLAAAAWKKRWPEFKKKIDVQAHFDYNSHAVFRQGCREARKSLL